MKTIRVDVDYAYVSRWKSFLSVFLHKKLGKGYLVNAKVIAKIVNDSSNKVKCFWFFTIQTLPDTELLNLISNSKHEVCLHYVKDLYSEWLIFRGHLAKLGYKRFCWFYNRHGVERFLARVIWRKIGDAPLIVSGPLKYFGERNCVKLDVLCYFCSDEKVFEIAKVNDVYHIHDVWLNQSGKLNRRGAFQNVLVRLLE
jgi:hypothetical protein